MKSTSLYSRASSDDAFQHCVANWGVRIRRGLETLRQVGCSKRQSQSSLIALTSVSIQFPGEKHGTACCKRLAAADFSKASVDGLLATDEVGGTQPLAYRVRLPKAWSESPFVGAAVVGDGIRTRNVRGQLESTDKRGRVRRAGICTSQEGVHLLEKVGSEERTHLYLSLGYEVESPTCRCEVFPWRVLHRAASAITFAYFKFEKVRQPHPVHQAAQAVKLSSASV